MRKKLLTSLLTVFIFSMVSLAQDRVPSGPSKIAVQPVVINPTDVESKATGSAAPLAVRHPGLDPEQEKAEFKEGTMVPPLEALLAPRQTDPSLVETGNNEVTLLSVPDLRYWFTGTDDPGLPIPVAPDGSIAVGPNDVVLANNGGLAFFSKMGDLRFVAPLSDWFSTTLPNGGVFDPKVLYDVSAGRFILSAAATRPNESWMVVSVSQGSDPMGNWRSYALDAALDGSTRTNNWGDQPTVSFDNQALYLSINMFLGDRFQYAKLRVLDKSVLYNGGSVTWFDFWDLRNPDGQSKAFAVRPAQNFGSAPAQYFINAASPFWDCNLTLWSLTNPLQPTRSLTRRSVSVPCYFLPPEAQQPDTAVRINTTDARIYDAVYRNGSLWTVHTVSAVWDEFLTRAAIRWYQIDVSAGTVRQQGTYGGAGLYYYYPALMPDSRGNLIVVFNRSGIYEFASAYYAGRLSTEPAGQLGPATILFPGQSTYVRVDPYEINRWGDYNGIALDPDGSIVWVNGMYAQGSMVWGTWIGGVSY